jgi:ATP-binding cassette subfamily F protein 3
VLEACAVHTGLTPNKARALLGRFLFSGADAEKPLDGLSGGERRRLSLAVLVASGANVLILDEPTNHLDIESREALEDALLAFEGSMLLVSHDRALLEAVGTRTVAVDDGKLRSYEGGWQEYLRVREERRLAAKAPKGGKAAGAKVGRAKAGAAVGQGKAGAASDAVAVTQQPARKADRAQPRAQKRTAVEPGCASERLAAATAAELARGGGGNGNGNRAGAGVLSKNARRRIRQLEREVEQAEEALAALDVELALPEAWATPEASKASSARHATAKRAVEEAFARWEAASP